jgi:hypothetical protein
VTRYDAVAREVQSGVFFIFSRLEKVRATLLRVNALGEAGAATDGLHLTLVRQWNRQGTLPPALP